MGTILQTSDYDSIRSKLGVTTDTLPNSDIDSIGVIQVGEAILERAVPTYGSLTGPDAIFLKAADVSLCAALSTALLETKMGQSFRQGDYSESEIKRDWSALRDQLTGEVQTYLLNITGYSGAAAAQQTLLVAAGPTSASTNWPTDIRQWVARITPHLLTWLTDNGLKQFTWENMP